MSDGDGGPLDGSPQAIGRLQRSTAYLFQRPDVVGVGLEHTADSVCNCRLDSLFDHQVRGATLIDAAPVVARLGLRVLVDSVPGADSVGSPLPDLRLGIDFTQASVRFD
jgi:hypothetical protein